MAVLTAASQLTLLELAKRKDPDGELAAIAEVLNDDNEILTDAIWLEANDTFGHKITRRTSLPAGSWRKLNAGVSAEASKTQEVYETIGMLESYAEADKDLVDSAPNPKQFRNQEAQSFLEGMSQTLATAIIYGSTVTTPEKFDGLSVRMPSLAATTNVIGCGGTGSDLTSIYMVGWGPNKVFMVYPKGSKSMGIKHTDLGEETKTASSTMYQVYRDHFQFKCGLVVKDDRCIGRVANIEDDGTSNLFDEDNLITILNRMPGAGRNVVLYCNATVQSQMEIALKDKSNVNYTPGRGEGLAGEPVVRFRGCPVRRVDAIVITEAAIS
jgi:hypothetical protein